MEKKTVVILGAGFGGLAAARELHRLSSYVYGYQVKIIDRSAFHVYTPLLYEMATGFLEHENIGSSKLLRSGVTMATAELADRFGADFVEASVTGIDWEARKVLVDRGEPVAFDYLVIALGAETNFYGIEGMKETAITLKSLRDADRLREHVHDVLHKQEKGIEKKIDIVIGGGGATGVELAAELTFFLRKHLIKGHIKPDDFQITLVEASPRILSGFDPDMSYFAAERLRRLGIRVLLDTCVKYVKRNDTVIAPRPLRAGEQPDQLICDFRGESEKHIDSDIIVWTGGIRGSMALEQLGVKLDDRGKRIPVDATLRVPEKIDAYAIGDSAVLMNPETKQPVPWLAQAAMAQGIVVARSIANSTVDRGAESYVFKTYPIVVPLGGKFAVAQVAGMKFRGFSAWLIKEAANLRYFLTILPLMKGLRLWWDGIKMYGGND